jgi:hypothetical protein
MIRAAIALFCLMLGSVTAAAGERPLLVELFTSEGCSSCPPADALLADLARRPGLLALSFHVDYWDRLGWKDPFGSAAATRRQARYARILGLDEVYTPQIVVDGRWQAVGSDRGAVTMALRAARQAEPTVPMKIALAGLETRIALDADPRRRSAALLLVAFDSRHVVRVGGGENDGRVLTHVDVVRGFAEIGRTNGAGGTITAPMPWTADRVAAILQQEDGRVIGVAIADRGPSS